MIALTFKSVLLTCRSAPLQSYSHQNVCMTMAAVNTIGIPVGQSASYRGLDEVEMETTELVREHVKLRHRPRCDAYKVRQRIFNERLAYLDSIEGEEQDE